MLRDVDGNRELIRKGRNGALFKRNEDTPAAILAALAMSDRTLGQTLESLLPEFFRQAYVIAKYICLMEGRA
ncbi:MAG: hypothetical protein EBT75_03825 [Proteobacteria bacterium]|nr:hypothetical protein [Pseudomonadota bacterium]NBS07032.1 hypothetical protein [Verrucomicrobiota bacterium]NBS50263.1 hypothetical protein [Verrucomicrobiota bacterium]NBS79611.1 hypothetical protein [bacterium]